MNAADPRSRRYLPRSPKWRRVITVSETLDYAVLTSDERLAIWILYHGERYAYERRDLCVRQGVLDRLKKTGWIDGNPEYMAEVRYGENPYRPAVYWLADAGYEAVERYDGMEETR